MLSFTTSASTSILYRKEEKMNSIIGGPHEEGQIIISGSLSLLLQEERKTCRMFGSRQFKHSRHVFRLCYKMESIITTCQEFQIENLSTGKVCHCTVQEHCRCWEIKLEDGPASIFWTYKPPPPPL